MFLRVFRLIQSIMTLYSSFFSKYILSHRGGILNCKYEILKGYLKGKMSNGGESRI